MTNHIPEQVEARITAIGEAVSAGLTKQYEQMLTEGQELQTIEKNIQHIVKQAGLKGMELVVGEIDREREKGRSACPRCGQAVYWKQYARRQCISTLGEFEIERAYYYCPACRGGWCPLDEELGLGRSELSPLAQELASYLGAFMPFRRAADFLSRSGLLHISHDTVNRVTVAVGRQLAEQQQAEADAIWAGDRPYPVSEEDTPPEALYLSGDGVRYLNTAGEGRELKVAAVYTTEMKTTPQVDDLPRSAQIDYRVSQRDAQTFTRVVEVLTEQRGLRQAERPVVLQDGAAWLWRHLAPLAGKNRTEIVDFYHAAGYLTNALDSLLPNQAQRTFWADVLLTCLKSGQPGLVTDTLRNLLSNDEPLLKPVQEACDYLRNQCHRMHYDDYLTAGLQIASGTIESGVKQVASDRLKQAGMRWLPHHAEAVAQVRAAILSHHPRWDVFWQAYLPPSCSCQSHALVA
jgi:hypothetical protein